MSGQYSHHGYMHPPPGWHPPYQGAPPIPPGVNVNPQQWQAGVWSFNPLYNMQRPPAQQVPWVAGQAWPQMRPTHQAQQASFNPYKKVIKPPSAEYLAEPLRDNPLGLTNMVPAKNRYGDDDIPEPPPETPWIWNPANLEGDNAPGQSRPNAADNRQNPSGRESLHGRHAESSRSRQSSEPPMPATSRSAGLDPRNNRHATDPTSNGRNDPTAGGGSSSTSSSNPPTVPPFDRPKNPEYYRRRGYADGYQPPPTSDQVVQPSGSAPPTNAVPQELESFTAKRELKPTFSTNIVRTPMHYRTHQSRSSSVGGSRDSSQSSMNSITSQMERLGTSDSSSNNPSLTRHSSMPASSLASSSASSSSLSGVTTYVDEPASILSPLMLAGTPKPSSRPIERYHTYPNMNGQAGLSTIAESPPTSHSSSRQRSQRHTPPESYDNYASSPARRPSSRDPTPPRTPSKLTPPRESTNHITPSPSGRSGGGGSSSSNSHIFVLPNPLINNPLPPPPREIRYLPISPPPRQGPHPANRKLVRKGFWNRRGDHLTSAGYIVYAPPELASPEELKDYPEAGDAFKDNFGTIVEYNPDSPELPESLPRYGKPPVQPYRDFIQYDFEP